MSQNINKKEVECTCYQTKYKSDGELIQCFLCKKYQHKKCVLFCTEVKPHLCFNCQIKYNHMCLKWVKTLCPAKDICYYREWETYDSFPNGKQNFSFNLAKEEVKSFTNAKENYYLALIWCTNKSGPFKFGFPEHIEIRINDNDFYNTCEKARKLPFLLSLNSKNSKRNPLLRSEQADKDMKFSDYMNETSNTQTVEVSFFRSLSNYLGNEFESDKERHYVFYIGIFEEVVLPTLNEINKCKTLEEKTELFKKHAKKKIKKYNVNENDDLFHIGNEIYDNITDNKKSDIVQELKLNFTSYISDEKIITPVRGLYCTHSEILDFTECIIYMITKKQIYLCPICKRQLNFFYIDNKTESLFNKYKGDGLEYIIFDTKFKVTKHVYLKENSNEDQSKSKSNDSESDTNEVEKEMYDFYFKKQNENIIEIIDSDDQKNKTNFNMKTKENKKVKNDKKLIDKNHKMDQESIQNKKNESKKLLNKKRKNYESDKIEEEFGIIINRTPVREENEDDDEELTIIDITDTPTKSKNVNVSKYDYYKKRLINFPDNYDDSSMEIVERDNKKEKEKILLINDIQEKNKRTESNDIFSNPLKTSFEKNLINYCHKLNPKSIWSNNQIFVK